MLGGQGRPVSVSVRPVPTPLLRPPGPSPRATHPGQRSARRSEDRWPRPAPPPPPPPPLPHPNLGRNVLSSLRPPLPVHPQQKVESGILSIHIHISGIVFMGHRVTDSRDLGLSFGASGPPSPGGKPPRRRGLAHVSRPRVPSTRSRVWPTGGPWCLLWSKHPNLSACPRLPGIWDHYPPRAVESPVGFEVRGWQGSAPLWGELGSREVVILE